MSAAALRWGFRVATRPEDGWGHILRCLSLARALDGTVNFYVDSNRVWETRMNAAGHAIIIEPDPSHARALDAALADGELDATLFDGYTFEKEVPAVARRFFAAQVVDFAGDYEASFVISPGLGAEAFQYGKAQWVAGAGYAMLRPDFAVAHDRARKRSPSQTVKQILVAFGGRDSSNATGLVLDAIATIPNRPQVTIVLPSDAPHRMEIQTKTTALGALLLLDVEDMAELYLQSDLAIGAGGVSLLERICCGLPSLIVVQSDNQMLNISAAETLGLAQVLGKVDALDCDTIASALVAACQGNAQRSAMRERGLQLVDGRGATRVSFALQQAVLNRHVHSLSL